MCMPGAFSNNRTNLCVSFRAKRVVATPQLVSYLFMCSICIYVYNTA